jgi:dTMP kinase
MGRLIVIDGLDGTGKATQTELLKNHFINSGYTDGVDFAAVDFPRYGKPSCVLVEHYLQGKFGEDPSSIDPKVASTFYTIDRVESYLTEIWPRVYRTGGTVVADRYTCSNVIHQGSKFVNDETGEMDMDKFGDFINWLYHKEYYVHKLPMPDKVIYLKVSKEANEQMLKNRSETPGDIHEANLSYLDKCRVALEAYQKFIKERLYKEYSFLNAILPYITHHFIEVNEKDGVDIRTREDIAAEIQNLI